MTSSRDYWRADSLYALLPLALLRPRLHQFLSQNYQPEDLRPLGNDIAGHLAPLRIGIAVREQDSPADPCDQQKDAQRVIAQLFPNRRKQTMWRFAAFGRSDFIHVFGREHGYYEPGPIGNGVPEKRAPVRIGVPLRIEDNPAQQNQAADDAEGMAAKERVFASSHVPFDDAYRECAAKAASNGTRKKKARQVRRAFSRSAETTSSRYRVLR